MKTVHIAVLLILCGLAEAQAVPSGRLTSASTDLAIGADFADADYVIAADDVIATNVWNEPEVTREMRVRPDGKISLPLVGEFPIAGLTVAQAQSRLAKILSRFVADPIVTVTVKSFDSMKVTVAGEVARPGTYPLRSRMTVLEALAVAGGLTEFAKRKDIYILRDGQKLPFDYKAVARGKNPQQNVLVLRGDMIFIP